MGKITNIGRVQRGVDLVRDRGSVWVGLGRTTVWPDEGAPPDEDITDSGVEELFAMKLFDESAFVVADPNGSVYFKGAYYRKLTTAEAYAQQISDFYLKFELLPHEFPGLSYRQIGVFVDSIPAEGFSNYKALSPSNFADLGRLVYLSNETLQNRYVNTRHVIEVVIPG